METIVVWLWEWYKTIVGVITLSVVIAVVLGSVSYYLWWRFTRSKCPECGGIKFGLMIGGPPKCIKCGWQQDNFSWSEEIHPNFIKHGYHMVDWSDQQ